MYIDVIKKFWIKIRVEKEGATEGANNNNTSKQGAWGGDFGGGGGRERERGMGREMLCNNNRNFNIKNIHNGFVINVIFMIS